MMRFLVTRLVLNGLASAFRRVCWVGDPPSWPAEMPVVVYANHHHFFDGHLLWYALHRGLGRSYTVWMEDWDRFPMFAACGAMPFPTNDPARRLATIRQSITRMRRQPMSGLAYFPEARLHAPDEGIQPFSSEAFSRFDRIFPPRLWVPVALHVTWWGESLPTALLLAGEPHERSTGDEHMRLERLWTRLRGSRPADTTLLFDGKKSPDEDWDMRISRPLFERYLR